MHRCLNGVITITITLRPPCPGTRTGRPARPLVGALGAHARLSGRGGGSKAPDAAAGACELCVADTLAIMRASLGRRLAAGDSDGGEAQAPEGRGQGAR